MPVGWGLRGWANKVESEVNIGDVKDRVRNIVSNIVITVCGAG